MEWLKNGKKMKPSDRIKPSEEGTEHTLVIDKAVLDDGAEYTAKIGEATTKGKLTVTGMTAWLNSYHEYFREPY